MKNRILKNTISTSIVLILFFTVLMPVFSQTDWSNSQVRTPITKYSMLQMQSSRQTMIPVESYSYDVSGSSVSYSGTEPELTINWSLSQIPQPPSGYLDVGLHMTISSNLTSTTILSSAIIINCSNPLSNSTRHPYLHALDLNYLTPMVFNSSISQWEVIPDYFFYTNNYTLGFNITYTSELPFENCTYYAFFTSRIPASIKVNGGITATAYEGDGLNLTVEIYCLQYLTNLSYRWESSLDGLLSTSRNCSGVLLSSGIHNITLRISADGMTETSRTLYSIVVMLSPAFWFTAGASARHDCEVMYEMPASNSTKFFFNITNGKLRSPPVSSGADDRALIFGVCDGVDAGVYCIRQTDGELIWKKPLPVTSDPSPVGGVEIPPVVAGNKVYVITKPVFPLGLNSLVLGLNLTTGQEEINISVGQQVCSSSTIIGRYMYFTTINDVLYCVDLDNNSVRWSTPVPLSFASVPTVWHGVVFVGTVNVTDNFLAFKAETGELLWNTTLPDCVTVPPLIAVGSGPNGEDLVVVAGRNLSMRAYNAGRIASMSGGYQDSDLIWSWNGTGALDESFGYGLATDSLGIFAQTSKGRVFFLDATTGSDVGNFTSAIQGAFIGFPAFSYPSSKAAFMYQNGTVIVLNTTTRQIVWEYRTVAPSLCGPVLTSKGLFACNEAGNLVAIGPKVNITLTGLSLTDTEPSYGQILDVSAGVANFGNIVTDVSLQFYYNQTVLGNSTTFLLDGTITRTLLPGERINVSVPLSVSANITSAGVRIIGTVPEQIISNITGERWTALHPHDTYPRWPEIQNTTDHHGRTGANLTAVPTPIWASSGWTTFYGTPAIAEERIFISAQRNTSALAVCLNASNGVMIWERALDGIAPAGVTYRNGVVYLATIKADASPAGSVYALDADNGNILWNITMSSPISGGVLITETAALVHAYDGTVYVMALHNGSVIASRTLSGNSSFTPLYSQGFIFTADRAGHVYRLNDNTLSVTRDVVYSGVFAGTGMLIDGVGGQESLILMSEEGIIYCLATLSLNEIWSLNISSQLGLTGNFRFNSALSFDGTYIVFAGPNSTLAALYPANGTLAWTITSGQNGTSGSVSVRGSAVSFADGYVAANTLLYGYNRTGPLWTFGDDGFTLPIAEFMGFIVAPNSNGTLYCLRSAENMPPVAVINSPSLNATFRLSSSVDFTSGAFDYEGDAFTHIWDFGDGNISAEQNPNHTYAAPGTYTVRLTVIETATGRNSSASIFINIVLNTAPFINSSSNIIQADAGSYVNFTALYRDADSDAPVYIRILLSNGSIYGMTSADVSPDYINGTLYYSEIPISTGIEWYQFECYDGFNTSRSEVYPLQVFALLTIVEGNLTITVYYYGNLSFNISAYTDDFPSPLEKTRFIGPWYNITITNNSSGSGAADFIWMNISVNISGYDILPKDNPSATSLYGLPNSTTVLTEIGDIGRGFDTDLSIVWANTTYRALTGFRPVYVLAPFHLTNVYPVPHWTVNNNSDERIMVGQDVLFNATMSSDEDGDNLTFKWKFGDNTEGEGAVITHSYKRPGIYQVTLIVDDSYGGRVSQSFTIRVYTRSDSDIFIYLGIFLALVLLAGLIAAPFGAKHHEEEEEEERKQEDQKKKEGKDEEKEGGDSKEEKEGKEGKEGKDEKDEKESKEDKEKSDEKDKNNKDDKPDKKESTKEGSEGILPDVRELEKKPD